ncbi:AAA family ATPase [Dietzia timorensis]|uniref:ATPase family gene 2 protein n=1 Tax=Dietzia timorensis TaxID=499555 RepID=A0A173LNT2_9ACTN|nr:AAA family ATPase [Dietzia timorensis]ANI93563.1 ATPase family gene 2 protein [Dietzia timorensis]
MTDSAELTLTLRVLASASDARRGIVRLHPEVLTALGMRQWDALELVGARTTAAVAAASPMDTSQALCIVDEVVAANCGLTDDSRVVVRPAEVIGATEVIVDGPRLAQATVTERVLRSALLGKVARVGDSLTLMPRDLGPSFPTGDTTRTLSNYLGAAWSSQLITVTATEPAGSVSIRPSTAVRWVSDAAAPAASPSPAGSSTSPMTSDATSTGPRSSRTSSTGSATRSRSAAAASPSASSTASSSIADLARTEIERVDRDRLVGVAEQAETLEGWLRLALDRPELLQTLGAAAHLGVMVTGPAGVGKATVVRSVCGDRPCVALDGPLTGSLSAEQRLEAVQALAAEVRSGGGVLLINDVDALLPATPEPVATLILSELRDVAAAPGAALVVTAVTAESADSRLRAPDLCDRVLDLPLPDASAREGILESLLADVPQGELDFESIAARTPGYVAGDLRALCREAGMRAAGRAGEDTDPRIEQDDLDGALRVIRPMSRSGMEEVSLGSITLDDVGDMVETRQALTESVLWPLQHPESFQRLGIEPPRGVLLYGPPGCGKTFLVRALAASGQLTAHIVKGAELMDKWVGSSEKAVRELFQRARDSAPSLIFLDEVDALAPRRGQSSDSGVGDRVVASLLTELDGAEPLTNVAVLGATNRPELIDPALLRPGRLERLVFVPPPDADARGDILRTAGRDVPLAESVDLDALAADLDGYSAADCAALLREAAMTAMRRDLDAAEVTGSDITAARSSVRPSLDPAQVESLRTYADSRSGD